MTISLGYRALDVGRSRAYALINQLSVHEPIDWLCKVFEINRSSYYAHRLKRRTPDVERLRLRSRVSELFSQSRSAAGSRSILSLMRDDGEQLGRFKVRSLMRELDLVSKQPGSHAYKRATVERLDIPNILNREFDVPASNQVWCGDISGTPGLPRFGPTARSPLCPTCSTWPESGASPPKRIRAKACERTARNRATIMPTMWCGPLCTAKRPRNSKTQWIWRT